MPRRAFSISSIAWEKTEEYRVSTPSRFASSVALPSARTLNPMMIASEADARLTLVSVIPPTPRSMTRSSTSSSIWIPIRASSSASTVPALSPLRIRLSWLVSFSAESRSSRLIRFRDPDAPGAAGAVQVRLDRHTLGLHVGVGPQVQGRIGGQHDRLQQRLDVGALLGGDVDEHRVATEILCHQTEFGELAADLGRVGPFLVDLVDRHHNRHIRGLGVVDGLHRLG